MINRLPTKRAERNSDLRSHYPRREVPDPKRLCHSLSCPPRNFPLIKTRRKGQLQASVTSSSLRLTSRQPVSDRTRRFLDDLARWAAAFCLARLSLRSAGVLLHKFRPVNVTLHFDPSPSISIEKAAGSLVYDLAMHNHLGSATAPGRRRRKNRPRFDKKRASSMRVARTICNAGSATLVMIFLLRPFSSG
jgi:hypothetical protein